MTRDLDAEGPVPGQARIDVTKPRLLDGGDYVPVACPECAS